ncbi:hypothetical protein DL767_007516 [Monosporascus sp. MG133]|nr:hypothetical protein DL767_007516 [Monosporascus sp. MG133]
MADPFGIIGVIGVATQIIQIGVQFGLDWKDVPADARSFINELQALKTVLCETNMNIVLNQDFGDAFHGRHSTLLSQLGAATRTTDTQLMLSACRGELEKLLKDLKKRAQGHRLGWEQIKGAFLAKKTREAVENLHRQCQKLNSMMAIDALALGASIHKEVKEARKEQQDWHIAQVKMNSAIKEGVDRSRDCQISREAAIQQSVILDWLTPVDYVPQQNDYLSRRQAGTGQWLLDSKKFQEWLETGRKTLFCPGIPGAGKTILASIVVNDLTTRFSGDPTIGVAYIYCNFRRQDEQKVDNLLASLLKQLAERRSSLPGTVKDLYDRHKANHTRPSLDEILTVLQSVLALYSRVFIVVDALDECQVSDGCRMKFLSEIFGLQAKSGPNIFATSRFIPEVTEKFKGSTTCEIRAHDEDVRKYLDNQISQSGLKLLQTYCEEIKAEITKVVEGMFLLAQLHFEAVRTKKTLKKMKDVLNNLPTGPKAYDHAYEEAMKRVMGHDPDSEELAKQVLSWITCAKRPLTTLELRHALAVEVGESGLDEDNLPDIEDIVSVCAGLVTIDEESKIIRLVHYTAQEYFDRRQKDWFPNAERDIANICITYLLFDTFEIGVESDREIQALLERNPLYDYAARNWGHHTRAALIWDGLIFDFLDSETKVSSSSQALLLLAEDYGYRFHSPGLRSGITGIHLAAFFGLEKVVKDLLKGRHPDPRDYYGRTPLSLAAMQGYEAVVELLLANNQVDPDCQDVEGRTPLSLAAGSGQVAVVERLLANDRVNPSSHDDDDILDRQTWAVQGQSQVPLRLLLPAYGKVDLDEKKTYGGFTDIWTPLFYATDHGHEAVVKLLLADNRVDPNFKDRNGRTPLSVAAMRGHEAAVKLLLANSRVSPGFKDIHGQTPLLLAARNGHETVVKLLLADDRVDPDSKDKTEQTPLFFAVMRRHEAVVKMLLADDRVDPDSKDINEQTPLGFAMELAFNKEANLLLTNDGVDPDFGNDDTVTPLSTAALNGPEAVVKLLIESGADPDLDVWGYTPLAYAVKNGHETIVQLLLTTGKVDPDSKDDYGGTLLSWAACKGREALVRLLLATGKVDADSKDNDRQTPLSWAAAGGHEAVVKLLLYSAKVDADSKHNYGQTPLSWAAERGHEAVVKLLLYLDKVDADSKDNEGRTPLSWAAAGGYEAVVKLLLDTGRVGADSKATGDSGRTPLSYAAANGHAAVVRSLLNKGVAADSKDNDGRTPLSWAVRKPLKAFVSVRPSKHFVLGSESDDFVSGSESGDSVSESEREPSNPSNDNGYETVVKLLLEKGVDPDFKDNDGRTPLSWAAGNGRDADVKLLLNTGKIEADSKDRGSRTPLSYAAENGHEAVVRLLLHTGKAEPDSKDSSGRMPLLWAAARGHESIVKLLRPGAIINMSAVSTVIYDGSGIFHYIRRK